MHRTHGLRRTPEYRIWSGIRTRCLNPRADSYAQYGAKGVRLADSWSKFEQFLADMGPRPSPQHSVDREDVRGGYGPDNCRWATLEEQARNKSNLRRVTIGGETKLLVEWAALSGTPLQRIWDRLYCQHWPAREAVFEPKRPLRPTHCKNGHLLDETARFEESRRRCTVCKKAYDAEYRRRRAEEAKRGRAPRLPFDEED